MATNKTARQTLRTTLLASNAAELAKVLIGTANTVHAEALKEAGDDAEKIKLVPSVSDVVKGFGKTFAEAVKGIPAALKALEDEAAAARLLAEQAAAEEKARKEAEQKALLESLAEKKAKFKESLIAAGADAGDAEKYAEQMIQNEAKKATAPAPSFKYERVAVVYKGQEFDMPVRGNMPTDQKEALKDSGLADRDAFIKAYRKTPAEVPAGE